MPASRNLNLHRRLVPGLLTLAATALLAPALLLRRRAKAERGLTVFASYMVGDLYMALPALRKIAAARPTRVLCRPGCVELLAREGVAAEPFSNAFRERGLRGLRATWRAARALRGGGDALDLDADPRTAFWMRLAGLRAVSYRRAFGVLFDETFPLPEPSAHQADRDLRVVEEYLRRYPLGKRDGGDAAGISVPPSDVHRPSRSAAPWIFSVWTRKPAKNWPLKNWETILERALAAEIPLLLLDAPDGDEEFRAFRARWNGRAPFLKADLPGIADAVREAAGVVATDNFLGHMAGYHGKPVLWLNRVSPSEQVLPRGPRTVEARIADSSREEVEGVWRAFESLRAPAPGGAVPKP